MVPAKNGGRYLKSRLSQIFSHHWVDKTEKQTPIKFCLHADSLHAQNINNNWVVVSNMLYFHPYLGKLPILTDIFQMG